MSQAELRRFVEEIAKAPAVLETALSGANEPGQLERTLVQCGRAMGYSFTEAEARAWISDCVKPAGDKSRSLTDTELDAVNGGVYLPTGGSSGGSSDPLSDVLRGFVKRHRFSNLVDLG